MVTKWSDCHKVDNKYTEAKFNYVWRIFKIGKYKGQEVKKICYCNPSYIDWCLKNWEGFKLTKHEHWDYLQGLRKRLSQNPDNEELALKVRREEALYSLRR